MMARSVRTRLLAVAGCLTMVAMLGLLPGLARVAQAAPADSSVTLKKTMSRAHLNADGTESIVDTRTVSVTVSQTRDLRGQQQIDVSWSGAHPTGGLQADPNSTDGRVQEYPMVLMECRGIDSPSAPANQRLDPTTCWTQTPEQRYSFDNNVAFQPWRVDRWAAPSERRRIVGFDGADPAICQAGDAETMRVVPFVDTDGNVFYNGNGSWINGCGLAPEESTAPDKDAPPHNTTYGQTAPDGSGSTKFVVWTAQQNASLGCSDSVPCALVLIPIMGISCDVSGRANALPPEDVPGPADAAQAAADCTKTGHYQPGEIAFNKTDAQLAVEGQLWFSASNWRNRITVPLTFAPFANFCDTLDPRVPLLLYGSELLSEATNQWSPAFCKDPSLFKFQQVHQGEPLAKSALSSGSIPGALISRPPDGGWSDPATVVAPVAVSGFAISYDIDYGDDASVNPANQRQPYTQLRLTPRLLAKLLTESYYGYGQLLNDYKALKPQLPDGTPNPDYKYIVLQNNPIDMAADPEFQALNPGLGVANDTVTASTLLAIASNSDVMYALTSYINADPDARAFLSGQPDPWGMVVNPAYQGIALPLESWPQLDTFTSPDILLDGNCLANPDNPTEPVKNNPLLPLIASPVATLNQIALAVERATSNAHTACKPLDPNNAESPQIVRAIGYQTPGTRFMLGLTTLADAQYYDLDTAALQSSPNQFVEPGDGSLRAAMLTTRPDASGTWPLDYNKLRLPENSAAYPGTMAVYLATTTAGLDSQTALQVGTFLDYAAIRGQRPGFDQGEIPTGYLPMTAQNGLCEMAFYTTQVALAVADQNGAKPVPGGCLAPPPTPQVSGGGGAAPPGSAPQASPSGPLTALPSWQPALVLPRAYTTTETSGVGGWILPVMALVALLALVTALATRAGVTMRMASRLSFRLSQLAELRRRP